MREMDRIREKSMVMLEPRQIGWLVVGWLVVACAVFAAGYRVGLRHAPTPSTVPVLESPKPGKPLPAALVASPTKANAASEVEYTYDKRLTQDSAPVEVYQDKTMELVAKKRTEFLARSRQGSMDLAGPMPSGTTGHHASSAFAGARLPTAKRQLPLVNARPAVTRAARQVVDAPVETALEVALDKTSAKIKVAQRRRAPASATAKGFTIQIKAFRSKNEASGFMQILKERGYKPYLVTADVGGRGRFYRVRLGKFSSLDAAHRRQDAFEKAENLETIVTKL